MQVVEDVEERDGERYNDKLVLYLTFYRYQTQLERLAVITY